MELMLKMMVMRGVETAVRCEAEIDGDDGEEGVMM